MFSLLGDLNLYLDPRVDVMSHGVEVTCLAATDLGAEVPDRAQYGILGGVDVVGTSTPDPVRLTSYSACSASFFSRNSIFLSQQFSRNSIF